MTNEEGHPVANRADCPVRYFDRPITTDGESLRMKPDKSRTTVNFDLAEVDQAVRPETSAGSTHSRT